MGQIPNVSTSLNNKNGTLEERIVWGEDDGGRGVYGRADFSKLPASHVSTEETIDDLEEIWISGTRGM